MDLDVFSRNESVLQQAAVALEAAGFHPCRSSSYVHTLVVDLQPTEEQIFASFRPSARRKVRQLEKHALEIRSIDHPYVARLEQLIIETLQRTDGTYVPQDWPARIALSQSHPHLSRIIGVFRTDRAGPEALVSFLWGAMHGDHGQYRDGGSTRVESGVPLSYALMWDLMRWAKRQGAHWFDLGGVTDGHKDDATDLLGGISDFKRHFTTHAERVGDGWVLNAMTLRARAVRALVHARSRIRSWR
jgi:lipid II:glycine glycyltransferase (peptidoglycan interpeptide bridge formation enzyme)